MTDPDHLFVYGTLRVTARHPMGDLLRAHADPAGSGTIRARLYLIPDPDDASNAYPGALPSPDPGDRVMGELYRLTAPDTVLPRFDAYEACSPDWPEPHEFLRRRVAVTRDDGTVIVALCYLYTWDVAAARHIPSGDWRDAAPDVR